MTSASAWSSVPPAARARLPARALRLQAPCRPHNWGVNEPVVTALARIEQGLGRGARGQGDAAPCGMRVLVGAVVDAAISLPVGEAARADVAVAIAQHENNKERYCVINDFACVVNRDAAMSMACAIGKYARGGSA